MVDVFGALVAASHHDFLWFVQEGPCDAFNLAAHCGREEQRVALFRNARKNLVHIFLEPHVEHFVGFVEHHVVHVVQLCHAPFHQVDESSRRGDDDVHAPFECIDLVDD